MDLLEKLVDSLENKRRIPLKHSLLIVSGIEDKRTGDKYLKKFDRIYKNYTLFIKENYGSNLSDLKKAEHLSEFLTNPIRIFLFDKRGIYKNNKFLFHEVIDARLSINPFSKRGNCIGLTSLYNALAQEDGIYTGIYKEREHVLSRVIISDREYAVENTSTQGFNVRICGPVGKGSNNDLLADVLVSRNYPGVDETLKVLGLAKRISPNTSLIYFNLAVFNHYIQKDKEALEEINKSIEIDPFNPKQYKFRSEIKKLLGDRGGARKDKKRYRELKKIN